MCFGKIDFSRVNTDPGSNSTFSPPTGWKGDYVAFLRERWRFDPGFRQHAGVISMRLKRGDAVDFHGRYASEALKAVKSLQI